MNVNLNEISNAIMGGALIGLSVTIMLLFNGRVTGISGIVFGLFSSGKDDKSWRVFFILGLLMGGMILQALNPEKLLNVLSTSHLELALAGILVGFGTVFGNGCTSGHGVCGISRFSLRSIVATVTFIAFGIIAVTIVKSFF